MMGNSELMAFGSQVLQGSGCKDCGADGTLSLHNFRAEADWLQDILKSK